MFIDAMNISRYMQIKPLFLFACSIYVFPGKKLSMDLILFQYRLRTLSFCTRFHHYKITDVDYSELMRNQYGYHHCFPIDPIL